MMAEGSQSDEEERKRERERRLLGKGVYKSRIAGNP